MLSFHFPAVAGTRYAEAIAAAAEETGVPISIAPNAHQGMLARTARQHMPQGLTVQEIPSIYLDRSIVSLNCVGRASEEEIASAQARFCEETGWQLEIKGAVVSRPAQSDASNVAHETSAAQNVPTLPNLPVVSSRAPEVITPVGATRTTRSALMSQHDAIQVAQQMLSELPGYYKAGGEVATTTLLLRFYFPLVAQTRYADVLAELEAQTGWQVRLHQTTHQQALIEMARRLLPSDLTYDGVPSLHLDQQLVMVNYVGHADPKALQDAQRQFLAETGWQLQLIAPGKKRVTSGRMLQGEAMSLASETFKEVPGFYRVGADASKGILWVHFHFPEIAKQRYGQQIADLAGKSGWKVYLYPYVHQKALIEAARRLLPAGVEASGKASLYQDSRTLTLTCSGSISAEEREDIRQRFSIETGWTLDLRTAVEEFYI
jgi:hypothetical protein